MQVLEGTNKTRTSSLYGGHYIRCLSLADGNAKRPLSWTLYPWTLDPGTSHVEPKKIPEEFFSVPKGAKRMVQGPGPKSKTMASWQRTRTVLLRTAPQRTTYLPNCTYCTVKLGLEDSLSLNTLSWIKVLTDI